MRVESHSVHFKGKTFLEFHNPRRTSTVQAQKEISFVIFTLYAYALPFTVVNKTQAFEKPPARNHGRIWNIWRTRISISSQDLFGLLILTLPISVSLSCCQYNKTSTNSKTNHHQHNTICCLSQGTSTRVECILSISNSSIGVSHGQRRPGTLRLCLPFPYTFLTINVTCQMWNSLIVIVSVSYSHDHLNSHEAAVPNLLSVRNLWRKSKAPPMAYLH